MYVYMYVGLLVIQFVGSIQGRGTTRAGRWMYSTMEEVMDIEGRLGYHPHRRGPCTRGGSGCRARPSGRMRPTP